MAFKDLQTHTDPLDSGKAAYQGVPLSDRVAASMEQRPSWVK
jgi:hypothetical protein